MTGLLLVLALGSGAPGGCDSVPVLNQRVIAFVKDHVGKRVGTGECWDLAAQALAKAGATWDGAYGFGKRVDPLKECVHPGDIMVGDGEGVVCIPAAIADEVAEEAFEQTVYEDFVQERVGAGHTIRGLYPMTDAANRPIFEAWRKANGR